MLPLCSLLYLSLDTYSFEIYFFFFLKSTFILTFYSGKLSSLASLFIGGCEREDVVLKWQLSSPGHSLRANDPDWPDTYSVSLSPISILTLSVNLAYSGSFDQLHKMILILSSLLTVFENIVHVPDFSECSPVTFYSKI